MPPNEPKIIVPSQILAREVYTNFSVSRAEPLALEVRVSNRRTQIMGFHRDYVAKNVKTGWTRQ
jgi:hypothetical protein